MDGWINVQAGDLVCYRVIEQGSFSSIAYDHRGHGKSDHVAQNAHYHFPDYVYDLLHIS